MSLPAGDFLTSGDSSIRRMTSGVPTVTSEVEEDEDDVDEALLGRRALMFDET